MAFFAKELNKIKSRNVKYSNPPACIILYLNSFIKGKIGFKFNSSLRNVPLYSKLAWLSKLFCDGDKMGSFDKALKILL